MKLFRYSMLAAATLALSASLLARASSAISPIPGRAASFAVLDRRARAGERLNVVFFGASLSWGANASNPIETSYRAQVARRLEAAYPRAHFRCFDAAIGGTGSQLGVFRLGRDVLSHRPDLVFLDFSANDDIYSDDRETLSSYESIVRRLVQAGVPTVQVIFPFEWNIKPGEMAKMKRRDAHLSIARAYSTAVGDAIELATRRVQSGVPIKMLWPLDGVHPGDEGYKLFADAAFAGLQSAVRRRQVCRAPAKMLFASTYMSQSRTRISSLGPLPAGWKVGIPNRTSAYFDFLMSRWLDDEVIASNRAQPGAPAGQAPDADADAAPAAQQPESLRLKFRGAMVMLLGEATLASGRYRASIDGQRLQRQENGNTVDEYDPGAFGRAINGNGHHAQVLATGLNPDIEHTLEIEPLLGAGVAQELRLESICVAGGTARASVWAP